MKKLILLIFVAAVIFSSCKKDAVNPQANAKIKNLNTGPTSKFGVITNVYVVGHYTATNGHTVAAYWINNNCTKLTDSSSDAVGNSICVNNGIVYVAGYTYNSIVNRYTPACWKNGVPQSLPIRNLSAVATGICVVGTDVYVAGYVYRTGSAVTDAALWKNGVLQPLPPYFKGSAMSTIASNGNDVYAAGYSTINSGKQIATYWKNGIPTPISDTTSYTDARGIVIHNNSVYMSGVSTLNTFMQSGSTGTSTYYPVYWIDGAVHVLQNNGFGGQAYRIAISSAGTVYIAGIVSTDSYWEPCYWTNGSIGYINNSNNGGLYGITTIGTDVYTTGVVSGYGCYTKNGVQTNLTHHGTPSDITIALVFY